MFGASVVVDVLEVVVVVVAEAVIVAEMFVERRRSLADRNTGPLPLLNLELKMVNIVLDLAHLLGLYI